MKKTFFTVTIQIIMASSLLACGCGGPRNDLKTDIDSSYAIFIGVITGINKSHVFHLNDGIGTGLKFINFNVIKSHKGLNPAQLKVTLFDRASNSSCEGIIADKKVGDTVLVFAEEFLSLILGSYMCGRHPIFQRLSPEEANFIDTAQWVDPRTKYADAAAYLQKKFPTPQEKIEMATDDTRQISLWVVIYLSVAINLMLGFLLFRKRSENKKLNNV